MATGRRVKSVGLDIGKRADPPAIVGLERYEGRALQDLSLCIQLPLGVRYPHLVKLFEPIVEQADIVMIDGNGVGQAIFDYLRGSFTKVWSVITTGGENSIVDINQQTLHIPKAMMIEQLIRDIEKRRMRFPMVGDVRALLEELKLLERRQGGRSTTIKYEAKAGAHDDLVMALALARLGFGLEGLEDLAA